MSERSQQVWAHNALLGAAAMIEACCERIERASTTTDKAKELASRLRQDVPELQKELETRIDK